MKIIHVNEVGKSKDTSTVSLDNAHIEEDKGQPTRRAEQIEGKKQAKRVSASTASWMLVLSYISCSLKRTNTVM